MTERPLLLLPEATSAARANKGGRGRGPEKLTAARQLERLGPRLVELERAFEQKRAQFQTTALGISPEDVLVLETAGTVEEFANAVSRIEGFEFLLEYDERDVSPDGDFFAKTKDGSPMAYTGRVYLVLSNQAAYRQLLALWQRLQNGLKFDHGLTRWRDVLLLLRDIRPWSAKDRLEGTGVLADWSERVQENRERVHCEIELWFRADEQRRLAAAQSVRSHLESLGGRAVGEGIVAAIHYHGISAQLPIAAVRKILDAQLRDQVQLVQCEQIQFLRASGQMAARSKGEKTISVTSYAGPSPRGPARVALLDGLPLQNHSALANRLLVDDPDGFEAHYSVDARSHGTEMASLVVWGDLNRADSAPIPQPLYVRPILQPVIWDGKAVDEAVPEGILAVDLIHRSVRRLFSTEADSAPAAPEVALINLSVGVGDRPFSGTMSPLARLVDWLSWTYGVLFVVSAGNHSHDIDTGVPWSKLQTLGPHDLATAVLSAIAADTRNRQTLSPAEAVNALTVGALHDDNDTAVPPATRLDPIPAGFPSPVSAHGLGYRRSIKPDLLMPGGRLQFDRPLVSHQTQLKHLRVGSSPGVKVASPGPLAGDLTHTTKSRGTSNAAALLSRSGAFLVSEIASLRQGPGNSALTALRDGLVLKALLAHGARWGNLGELLSRHLGPITSAEKRTELLTRLLGFGRVEIGNVAECTTTRVTGVGGGELKNDEGAEHRFPLPPTLSGKRGWRRLTVTLAWFTPVNPLSHRWRKAQLWFELPTSRLKVQRVGPDWQAAQRGTLQHDTFEGDSASAFVDGDSVVVRVSCREDAPELREAVPYCIAITLEVAEELGIDIYAEVRERVQARQQVKPRGN